MYWYQVYIDAFFILVACRTCPSSSEQVDRDSAANIALENAIREAELKIIEMIETILEPRSVHESVDLLQAIWYSSREGNGGITDDMLDALLRLAAIVAAQPMDGWSYYYQCYFTEMKEERDEARKVGKSEDSSYKVAVLTVTISRTPHAESILLECHPWPLCQ